MTAPRTAPFADRLALARQLLARGAGPMPTHLADQVAAAGRDARRTHDRLGGVLSVLEPGRHWRHRADPAPSGDAPAYLVAALLGCVTVCGHLKHGGPQPAIARLPLRRTDCARCTQTLRRPPPDEDDRCDVCGARGVTTFHPFAVRRGPVLLAGDACPPCADVLGIRQEVSA